MVNDIVSVIIPVFNRENLVSSAIESVLAQTYDSIEIILINDGSTDKSLSILKKYEEKFPHKIKVLDQDNQGQAKARNTGITNSSGGFIAFLDSDDIWLPTKLEEQLKHFTDRVGLVYSGIEIIDDSGVVLKRERANERLQGLIFPELLVENRMTGGSVVVSREALNKVGYFDPSFQAAENWDLWLRICREFEARAIGHPLIQYRIHNDNMSKNDILMLESKRKIIEKHADKYSVDQKVKLYSKLAEADYNFRYGIYEFSSENYRSAFRYFLTTNRISPFYKDSFLRLLRSSIGRKGNSLLRKVKSSIDRRK